MHPPLSWSVVHLSLFVKQDVAPSFVHLTVLRKKYILSLSNISHDHVKKLQGLIEVELMLLLYGLEVS